MRPSIFWSQKDGRIPSDLAERGSPDEKESKGPLGTESGSQGGTPVTTTAASVDATLPLPASAKRPRNRTILAPFYSLVNVVKRHWLATEPDSSSAHGQGSTEVGHQDGYTRNVEAGKGHLVPQVVEQIVVDRLWQDVGETSVSSADNLEETPPDSDRTSYPHMSMDQSSTTLRTGWAKFRLESGRKLHHVGEQLDHFFFMREADDKDESHYRMENWFYKKPLARWSAVWLIINWALGLAFVPRPLVWFDAAFYYGVGPALSVPVIVMVLFDWPRKRPTLYQGFITISIFSWSYYLLLSMYLCGWYTPNHFYLWSCGAKDFIGAFYFWTALPVIGLFGLKMHRLPALVASVMFFILSCVLIAPIRHNWIRSMINYIIFEIFLIYVHYKREEADRSLHRARARMKSQFKAVQKAQINERKAADSKRRLTSYIFHEVRVPLNSAFLAVQSMDSVKVDFKAKDMEDEFRALQGCLMTMSKVLNDVLDYNRLDSGIFESVHAPYKFHEVFRSTFVPLRLTAKARELELVTNLDPEIDRIARRAAYAALGESEDTIVNHMKQYPDIDGSVVGDEGRLRQVINNLVSNACKFTPAGGKITVTTRLISPSKVSIERSASRDQTSKFGKEVDHVVVDQQIPEGGHALSADHLDAHNRANKEQTPLENIVVRVEVADTGCGIKNSDMSRGRLFSPFNQTELGRTQGGKGTGLGLALVRQIVKLCGGRLGVKSQFGRGSTFWFELPLGVGRAALVFPDDDGSESSGNSTDVEKVQAALRSGGELPVPTSVPLPEVIDQAASRAAQPRIRKSHKSEDRQLLTMMEQAGKFEIAHPKHHTPLLEAHESPPGDETNTTKPTTQRPTYVHLPPPAEFHADAMPSPSSQSSITPLMLYDSKFSRGSPIASSSSPNFEHGLPVLVVDDDIITRKLMGRLLSRLGCKVVTADNGQVALDLLLAPVADTPASDSSAEPILQYSAQSSRPPEEKYAVIFLDNQMPTMSGLELSRLLRQVHHRKDYIVGITGNAQIEDQEEFKTAGANRVLTKPITDENVLKDILSVANERRQRRFSNQASRQQEKA